MRALTARLVAVAVALAALGAPSAAAEGGAGVELGGTLPLDSLDQSSTRCALLVCATSIAVASPVCTRPTFGTAQCTSVGTVGGHGFSPFQLPGAMAYDGEVRCSGDCRESRKSANGGATWQPLDSNGAGDQDTLDLGTRAIANPFFRQCLTITTTALANARAHVGTGSIVIERVDAPRSTDVKSAQACTF